MKYDWLREYEDEAPEPVGMSEAEQMRVLQNALEKVRCSESRTSVIGRKRRFTRWAAILAAVLAAGMLTAGASSGRLDAGQMLQWIFGAEAAAPEKIAGLDVMGYPIGQTQEMGGYTVSLHGAIGDRNSCYLVFDVAAPPDVVLKNKGGYGFQSVELQAEERPGGGFGYYCIELSDENLDEGTARFMVAYQQERAIQEETYILRLKGFTQYTDDPSGEGAWENEVLLADETWEFSFPLAYQDTSMRIPAHRMMALDGGGEAELDSIYISPLSIRLEYRQSLLKHYFDSRKASDTYTSAVMHQPEVVLHFRDGSVWSDEECLSGGGGSGTGRFGRWNIGVTYHFSAPVRLDGLAAVEVDGVLFTLPAGEAIQQKSIE